LLSFLDNISFEGNLGGGGGMLLGGGGGIFLDGGGSMLFGGGGGILLDREKCDGISAWSRGSIPFGPG